MRTIILSLATTLFLGCYSLGNALEYIVPAEPEVRLTRQDARDILALIENQLSAFENGDYRGAYQKFTSAPFQQVTSFDEFLYFVQSYPALGKNKSAIFGNVEIRDNVASIEGTLTAQDGKPLQVVYYFIKDNSGWKIIGIEPIPSPVTQEPSKPKTKF